MGKNGSVSRRRPYPYDAYISTVPVLFEPDDNGTLVGQKTRTLDQSAPTSFEYGAADPMKERNFPWRRLYGGFGDAIAPDQEQPRRYWYGEYLDTSIDGQTIKGPNFEDHVETIHAGAGEVRQFIQALHGGALTVFAICQNGVFRRASDGTWTASLTIGLGGTALPAGQFAQQAVRFKARHAAAVDGLYLATATGNIWQYNGAAWAQAVAAAGPGDGVANGECRYIEKVGDELWVGGNFWISKAEADPMLRASWSAVIWIGDQTAKITWLKQIEDVLIIFKEDGAYTVSAAGVDQELFPYLRQHRSVSNGRNATVWLNEMWVPFGDQSYRLTSQGTLTPDGLEQAIGNRSPIRGSMVATAGHNTWFLYEAYYDLQSDISYLLKHGSWVDQGTNGTVSLEFIDSAHHGSLYQWSNRITSMETIPGIHPSGNDRLYIGFEDGTLTWAVLPKTSPNPAMDGNCEFTNTTSYEYFPIHHSNFQADNKLFRGISVIGPYLSNTEWAEIEYRIDVSNSFADWQTLSPDNPKYTIPGQRLDFSTTSPVYSKLIQFRLKLEKNPDPVSSPLQLTPIVAGIVVHEQVRPSISIEYSMTVSCNTFGVKRNGQADRRRGVVVKDAILQLCAGPGTIPFMFADGISQELTIVDYREVQLARKKTRDLRYGVQITAIQLATLTPGSQSQGLTYDTLEDYTYGELEEGVL